MGKLERTRCSFRWWNPESFNQRAAWFFSVSSNQSTHTTVEGIISTASLCVCHITTKSLDTGFPVSCICDISTAIVAMPLRAKCVFLHSTESLSCIPAETDANIQAAATRGAGVRPQFLASAALPAGIPCPQDVIWVTRGKDREMKMMTLLHLKCTEMTWANEKKNWISLVRHLRSGATQTEVSSAQGEAAARAFICRNGREGSRIASSKL